MMKHILQTTAAVLHSRKFFYAVIGLFVVQAVWLALSAQYPMAFDESYHFGIIQIYSHQWTPFITSATRYSGAYGDLTRFDSYLYHYLMSFPYRLIALFVHESASQIILLRLLNVGLVVGGLFAFRRLLRRLQLGEGLTNLALLALVLIPVVSFMAATINYDNLVFLLVPIITGLTLTCRQAIVQHQKLPAASLLLLLIVGGLASLVKYAVAPIWAASLLYLLVLWLRSPAKAALLASFGSSFLSLRRSLQLALVIGLIISGGLFMERYAVNLIQYHSFAPDCSDVQDLSNCLQYGPWGRNYQLAANVVANNPALDPPLLLYLPTWSADMIYRLNFAINYDFVTYAPLPIPMTVAALIGGFGLVLCGVFGRSILRGHRQMLLLAAIIVAYVASLFYVNFTEYLHYRTVVAVNGRYLIVILPLLFAWLGLAYRQLFAFLLRARAQSAATAVSVLVIVLLLQGGGALTYLIYSQPIWYWQDKPLIDVNAGLKKVISPLIIGGQNS